MFPRRPPCLIQAASHRHSAAGKRPPYIDNWSDHEHYPYYAAHDAKSALVPFDYPPRTLRDHDVQIQVLFCGVPFGPASGSQRMEQYTIYPWCRATKSSAASAPSVTMPRVTRSAIWSASVAW